MKTAEEYAASKSAFVPLIQGVATIVIAAALIWMGAQMTRVTN